jgi:hypothetical protein
MELVLLILLHLKRHELGEGPMMDSSFMMERGRLDFGTSSPMIETSFMMVDGHLDIGTCRRAVIGEKSH